MFHFCFSMEGIAHMGASTVKWTTHDPCLVLSGSDSKLHTNFGYCEENNVLIYKAMQFTMTNLKFQEKSTYVRRWCKWCAGR